MLNPLSLMPALFLCMLCSGAWGQSVTLSGMLGSKALLIVDGSAPKGVAVGDTFKGVKIVSTQGDQAVLEIAGNRFTLRVGDTPASVGSGGGGRIVLPVGHGGHFFAEGQINGKAVLFMVDTGATTVGMSEQYAQQIGLNYKHGERYTVSTANGVVPAWRVLLDTVRVGEVTLRNVQAGVSAGSMPHVLLGNSFLGRFSMTRTNDQMVLEKRY